MTPSIAFLNVPDGINADAMMFGDAGESLTVGKSEFNVENLGFREFGSRTLFAGSGWQTTFGDHVVHVPLMRVKKKVRQVPARRVVAGVTDFQSFGHGSVRQNPYHNVRSVRPEQPRSHLSVALFSRTLPFMADIRTTRCVVSQEEPFNGIHLSSPRNDRTQRTASALLLQMSRTKVVLCRSRSAAFGKNTDTITHGTASLIGNSSGRRSVSADRRLRISYLMINAERMKAGS